MEQPRHENLHFSRHEKGEWSVKTAQYATHRSRVFGLCASVVAFVFLGIINGEYIAQEWASMALALYSSAIVYYWIGTPLFWVTDEHLKLGHGRIAHEELTQVIVRQKPRYPGAFLTSYFFELKGSSSQSMRFELICEKAWTSEPDIRWLAEECAGVGTSVSVTLHLLARTHLLDNASAINKIGVPPRGLNARFQADGLVITGPDGPWLTANEHSLELCGERVSMYEIDGAWVEGPIRSTRMLKVQVGQRYVEASVDYKHILWVVAAINAFAAHARAFRESEYQNRNRIDAAAKALRSRGQEKLG